MARTNNLTNFLNDVATAIKTKLGDNTPIPASQFDTKIGEIETGGDYQSKMVNISANGSQTITPDSEYDALSSVVINVQVPVKQLQSKAYEFTDNTHIVLSPETGYDGFSSIDLTINVPGSTINNQDKTITQNGTYQADSGYTGLGTVTVNVPQEGGSGDIKLFETEQAMQADPNPSEGDLAVVYREEIQPVTEESEFDSCTFPNTVILDTAFSDSIYGRFRTVDDDVWFDGNVDMSSSSFRFDGWGESSQVRVEYTSQDGITYTRTDGGEELQEFGTVIKYEPMEPWNDVIGQFMKIGGNYFEGLFEYKNVQDYNQIKYIDEVSFENNTLTYSYNKYLDITPYKNVIQEQAEAFFENENQLTLVKDEDNIIIYLSKTTEGNGARSEVFLYDGVLHIGLMTNISNLQNFIVRKIVINSDGTIVSSVDLTYQGLNNNTSYVDTMPNTIGYILIRSSDCQAIQTDINNITSSGDWTGKSENPDYKWVYKYVMTKNQLDATADYVYEKTFYGKNGVESGTLQNKENLTKDEIKRRVDIWSNYNSGIVCPDDVSGMFGDCTNLTTIPELNTSNVTNMASMFIDCQNLTEIPLLDTSNVTDMNNMFMRCTSLTTIPLIDTSSVTYMGNMFMSCTSLATVPQLNTSSVTEMGSMFENCTSLTAIPLIDTSSVTYMRSMFANCTSLTTIPLIDTSSVTNMNCMFMSCTSLATVPQLNTRSVTGMYSMFYGCSSLTTIPLLDTSSVTYIGSMFDNCSALSNDSLNNILVMCTNATKIKSNKTLKYIGLTEEQANICKTLSNYQAFVNAGWTTGY